MPTPSVTVLMAVHNGMPYLREAVQSILQQEEKDFHFRILDNGSTDGGGDWLEEQAARHGQALPRLVVERLQHPVGRTAALNKALDSVDTEVTALLDADDKAAPNRVTRLAAFFHDNPDIDLVGSDITYIDGAGNILGTAVFPTDHDELCRLLPVGVQFARSACAFRTEIALAAGGYDRQFSHAQDLALWIAMLRQGARVAGIPEPLSIVRAHPGQSSRRLSLLLARAEDMHRLTEAMLEIPGLDATARQLAHVRGAVALWRLGRKRSALARAWRAFLLAPVLLVFNPLLWRGLRLARQRRASGW